ncbi:MAG TPA: hypothetical protein VIZ43_30450 [Trebonia sp.]
MTSMELEIDGLRRRYGTVTALDGLSFGVPAGHQGEQRRLTWAPVQLLR